MSTEQLYGTRTENQPRPESLAAGCPASGWVHEPRPPWRVIVSTDPLRLPLTGATPYDGDEATVDVDVWRAESRAEAQRARAAREQAERDVT